MLVIVELVDLLPDQGISSQEHCQAAILVSPFLELREVLGRACVEGELANVEVRRER